MLAVSRTSQAASIAPVETLLSAAGGNRTALNNQISPAWVSNSGVRSTSDILWSCIVTLTACIYTAIHLNVPPSHEGNWQFLWRKTKWVALALFAPEVVLYCALIQRLQARKFIKEMNELWATRQASLDHPEHKKSKLAQPDAPDSHSNDKSNVVQQIHVAQVTQQAQAPSEIPPFPLPKSSALGSEELTKDDGLHPVSSDDPRDKILRQAAQKCLSVPSTGNTDEHPISKHPDLEKGMITSSSQRFSLKYGLFVAMGGIVTHDVAKISDSVNGPLVLTPKAVIQFARRGVFPDISHGTISDKSKANLLGKGLVCMQVIWFLIQCIARATVGFPLALLEVHTMVHVVCALLMYAFWWEKSQDVSEPVVQDVSGDMDLLAMLLVMSRLSDSYSTEALDLVWYGKTALQDPLLDSPFNERRCSGLEPSDPQYEVKVLRKTSKSQILEPFDRSKGQVVALVLGQALNCGIGPLRWGKQPITYLTAKDVLRWSKLSERLDRFEQRPQRQEVAVSQSEDLDHCRSLWWKVNNGGSEEVVPRNALSIHVSDLPGGMLSFSNSNLWLNAIQFGVEAKVFLILLVALPLVYGAIYLATLNFHFPSQVEQLLWKIACIDIMGTIPLGVVFFVCILLIELKLHVSMQTIPGILVTPIFIFYALSRIYIVVESFISLRHVPIGVYAVTPWVQDIPHI